jgi:3-phenylpropionate/cinnamic acid dioxygenase small subunit
MPVTSNVRSKQDVRGEIEDFLYLEADLLDDRRYEEWLELLHDQLEYVVPLRRNVHSQETGSEFTRSGHDVLWFDEGKVTLTQRVEQIRTGLHWAEEPISRVTHFVTNVRVADFDGTTAEVSARFLVYRNRVDTETDLFAGRRRDTLVWQDDRWLLRKRVVNLDQTVLLAKNITFFF